MKRELNELKKTVGHLATSLDQTNVMVRRIAVSIAELKGGMAEVKAYVSDMSTNLVTKKEFSERMDGFSGLLLDSRHRWAVHADTLVQHDARLKKLESKPS